MIFCESFMVVEFIMLLVKSEYSLKSMKTNNMGIVKYQDLSMEV